MKLAVAAAIGAALCLPVPSALAQNAPSVQLPARERLIAAPALKGAVRDLGAERQRMRALEQHMELLLADARDVARGLRDSAVGGAPALDSVGKSPGRGTGRAGDRLGQATGTRGSQYESPLGSATSGIDGRLRGNKPRSSVLDPGGTPDGSGMAGSGWVTHQSWTRGGSHGTTTTTHDPRSGATVAIVSSARDEGGTLTHWSETTVDSRGNTTTQYHRIDLRGPNGDVPVVVERTEQRDGSGNVTDAGNESEREYEAGKDPPIAGPAADSQTAEEGTVGGMRNLNLPLGISCNPITGVCGPGLKLGSAQVNPGRLEGQSATGPRLRLDPRAPVINPDPNALENLRTPSTIDRDGEGPGASPPKP